MELVEVNCPRSLDLSLLNTNKYDNNTDSIRQTIDIYDSIVLWQEIKKSTGIVINYGEYLSEELKEAIMQILGIYSNYVGLKIKDLIIQINKDPYGYLNDNYNILSGILVALNDYFKSNLTNHELIYLAQKVNKLISYYLVGNYKKILTDGKIKNIGDNIYYKYFLFNNELNDNIEKIESIVTDNTNLDYLSIDRNLICIAVKNNSPSFLPMQIKKSIPNLTIKSCKNTFGNKVLVKYIK